MAQKQGHRTTKGNTFTQTEEMKEYWKIITTLSVITYFSSLFCRVEALADVTLAAWSKKNAGFRQFYESSHLVEGVNDWGTFGKPRAAMRLT